MRPQPLRLASRALGASRARFASNYSCATLPSTRLDSAHSLSGAEGLRTRQIRVRFFSCGAGANLREQHCGYHPTRQNFTCGFRFGRRRFSDQRLMTQRATPVSSRCSAPLYGTSPYEGGPNSKVAKHRSAFHWHTMDCAEPCQNWATHYRAVVFLAFRQEPMA